MSHGGLGSVPKGSLLALKERLASCGPTWMKLCCFAGMEGGVFTYGEAKVVTPRGDSVKVPFFRSTTNLDRSWVVPAVVFWHIVIQEGVMSKGTYTVEVEEYATSEASHEELEKLQSQRYIANSTTRELMVPIGELVHCLNEINLRLVCLDATIRSLTDIQDNSTTTMLSHGSVMGGFAQIPTCNLSRAELQDEFSLCATYPEYLEEGAPLSTQWDEAVQFFRTPPLVVD